MKSCRKAIIPVAGYGTRRLPITKAIEKCMLPLGNRPVVDYIVADCVKAGITDIYFVVSGDSRQLRDYYSRDVELETYLVRGHKTDKLDAITPPSSVTFHYIEQDMQDERYGTTIPVWLCRDYIDDDELVLVVMGDDVTYVTNGASDIERLIATNMPAILGVPMETGDLSAYGVIAQTDDYLFTHIVEKPLSGQEPSRMINVSKYVLPGSFMAFVEKSVATPPASGHEYYITDPLNQLVNSGVRLKVVQANGIYLDTGSVETWIRANTWLLEQGAL